MIHRTGLDPGQESSPGGKTVYGIAHALAIAPAIETPGLVVSPLGERSKGHEPDVIAALEVILDSTADNMRLQDTRLSRF
jgi:hypothetical protein